MKTHRITLAAFAASPAGFQNVSLLTGGIEAGGHGIFIDETTIETAMRSLLGKSVRAYLKHDGAAGDRLGEEIGFFSGIYRDGLQIRAANFEYLETFKQQQPETYAKLVELSAKAPDQFGVSLVLEYLPVWVLGDGAEVTARFSEKAPSGAVRNIPSMRVKSVVSADLVQRPAANPNGLLEIGVSVDGQDKKETTTMAANTETITVDAHKAELSTLQSTHVAALESQKTDYLAKLEQAAKDAKAALDAQAGEHVVALEKQAAEYKAALEKLTAEKDEAMKVALSEKDEAHKKALVDAEINGAAKLGVTPLVLRHAAAALSKLPKPGTTDRERWDQYTALLSENPEQAEAFRAQYLSRK